MKVFVKKISKEYFNYNPNGEILYSIEKDTFTKLFYIEEVGLFNKEDRQYGNSSFDICVGNECFSVYKYKKGLYKTPLSAKRKIMKMIKNYNEEDGYYI